jgi:hypothetical protein
MMSCEMHESMIVSLLFPEKVNMKYASAVHTIIIICIRSIGIGSDREREIVIAESQRAARGVTHWCSYIRTR